MFMGLRLHIKCHYNDLEIFQVLQYFFGRVTENGAQEFKIKELQKVLLVVSIGTFNLDLVNYKSLLCIAVKQLYPSLTLE